MVGKTGSEEVEFSLIAGGARKGLVWSLKYMLSSRSCQIVSPEPFKSNLITHLQVASLPRGILMEFYEQYFEMFHIRNYFENPGYLDPQLSFEHHLNTL